MEEVAWQSYVELKGLQAKKNNELIEYFYLMYKR